MKRDRREKILGEISLFAQSGKRLGTVREELCTGGAIQVVLLDIRMPFRNPFLHL
jgi:hypothetical protein